MELLGGCFGPANDVWGFGKVFTEGGGKGGVVFESDVVDELENVLVR